MGLINRMITLLRIEMRVFLFFTILLLIGNPYDGKAQSGEALFKSKGCAGCHSKSFDTFAPSLKTISKSYFNKREDLKNFLLGSSPGLIYKEPKTMKNIINNITKKLSSSELEALTDYLLAH